MGSLWKSHAHLSFAAEVDSTPAVREPKLASTCGRRRVFARDATVGVGRLAGRETIFLRRGRLAVAFVLSLAGAAPARAGAFNPEAGHGVVIVTSTFTDGRGYVDGRGHAWRAPGYSKFELQAHVEIGVTDWLALLARPRFMNATSDAARGFDKMGLGSSEFGLQARLFRLGSWTFAAQALARSPSWPNNAFEDRGGLEGRLLIGYAFNLFGRSGYLDLEYGVRTRKGRADEFVWEETLGLRVAPKFLVLAQMFGQQSLESPKRMAARGAPLGSRMIKAQLGIVADLDAQWSIGASVFRSILVREGSSETGASLSAWRKF